MTKLPSLAGYRVELCGARFAEILTTREHAALARLAQSPAVAKKPDMRTSPSCDAEQSLPYFRLVRLIVQNDLENGLPPRARPVISAAPDQYLRML